ncbi:MAG TPA: phosphoenolpyruvate--protein phosphotransferase, partial [Planctomycetaceae bacterium]|nr:phosphoenolpyruvate--protein phosphotransferase [Planctomycetaceae bacterium]
GVAIGKALILDREGYRITRSQIPKSDRDNEKSRLKSAIEDAKSRLDAQRQRSASNLGEQIGAIFSAHQGILQDPNLTAEWNRLIEDDCYSAEFAVSSVLNRYSQAFRNMGSTAMSERATDIRDVERTLLEALGGHPLDETSGDGQSILLSRDLTPSETANLDPDKVLGFCTEVGGPGGHTAIVARGMELPAVVGVGSFLHRIESNADIIIDGFTGCVILQPTEEVVDDYRRQQAASSSRAERLGGLRDLPAETQDGHKIELLANIEFPSEVQPCLSRGAEGVGLYRTEFLYLGKETEPTEEEQYEDYRSVVEALGERPVIMRTLDLGADKISSVVLTDAESNPFLGLRSIRLSLRQPKMFRRQLRAMLRAGVGGNLRIMFPLVTTLHELRTARLVLRQVIDDLEEEGLNLAERIEVGMMVEVPAAVMMLEHFVDEVDFISIGTNDLIQYTMAVDRGNEYVADLYTGHDPAVLRLIRRSVDIALEAGVGLSVCGEMSAQPSTALLLIGMGVTTLSAPPAALPAVKQAIRSTNYADCVQLAQRVGELLTAREIDLFINSWFAETLPELDQEV